MAMLTREQILARKLGQDVVTLSDGGTVKVRGLNRDEVLGMRNIEDTAGQDNYIIATGMIEPKMTPEDVAGWAKNDAAGDLVDVSNRIAQLSNMAPRSGKEATKSPSKR